MARKEFSVGERGEEEMYEKTEFVNVAVSDSIRSTRTEGDGGRGVERNKERAARGVRVARGKVRNRIWYLFVSYKIVRTCYRVILKENITWR